MLHPVPRVIAATVIALLGSAALVVLARAILGPDRSRRYVGA